MFTDMFLSFKQSVAGHRFEYAETLIGLAKVKLWKTKTKVCRLERCFKHIQCFKQNECAELAFAMLFEERHISILISRLTNFNASFSF